MRAIGLDIGTTTLCAALVNLDDGSVEKVATHANTAAVPGAQSWQRLQAPGVIATAGRALLDELLDAHEDVVSIGISGQMHGMMYLNADGKPLGQLCTWQDGRGNLTAPQGGTYAQIFEEHTGVLAASGFGLVTLFYDAENGLVPPASHRICTIGDFVAMTLCGGRQPLLHASHAAGLGGFDIAANRFMTEKMPASLPLSLLPQVAGGEQLVGRYRGAAVCCAIGDNQASVFGSLGPGVNALVNVGTGSQISALSEKPVQYHNGLECRPYVGWQYLSVGAALCGGYAYHLLREFYRQTARMLGAEPPADLYRLMDQSAGQAWEEERLQVDTRFSGTRQNPGLRGSIGNIGVGSLTPGALSLGVLEGICEELFQLARGLQPPLQAGTMLAAGGNGLRNSPLSRRIFARRFGMPLAMPKSREEASFGAALISAAAAGCINLQKARTLVTYENETTGRTL